MRIIVCGGRGYNDAEAVRRVLSEYAHVNATVVHGGAPGGDSLADAYASWYGMGLEVHRAKWKLYGRRAGPIRNREMAKAGANLLIAFPGGAGTANMVALAMEYGIPVRRVP